MAGLKVAELKQARTYLLSIRQKHGLGYRDGHIKRSPLLSYIELISGLMMFPSITLSSHDKDLNPGMPATSNKKMPDPYIEYPGFGINAKVMETCKGLDLGKGTNRGQVNYVIINIVEFLLLLD